MKLKFAPPAGQSNASQIRSRETTEPAHGQRLIHIAETNASECAARRCRNTNNSFSTARMLWRRHVRQSSTRQTMPIEHLVQACEARAYVLLVVTRSSREKTGGRRRQKPNARTRESKTDFRPLAEGLRRARTSDNY